MLAPSTMADRPKSQVPSLATEHPNQEAEYGQRIQESRLALFEAVEECSVPDWDGYGAAPANPMSAAWAERS